VNRFAEARLAEGDYTCLADPLLVQRLILLIQVVIRYLFECQDALKAQIAELEEQFLAQRAKVKLLLRAQNSSRELLRDAYHDFEKCPICAKKFKSIRYVDQHIEKLHAPHLLAWRSLRIDNPIDPSARVQELESEIAALKALMNEQTRKFADSLAQFDQRLLAQRRKCGPTPAPTITFVEFEPPKPRPQKPPPPPPCPRRPIGQSVVAVTEIDSGESSASEPIEHVRRKTAKEARRVRAGFPANYVTPGQVANILRYDNATYERLQKTARDQLEKDFPIDRHPKQAKRRPPVKEVVDSESSESVPASAPTKAPSSHGVTKVSSGEGEDSERGPTVTVTTAPLLMDDDSEQTI
jgi:hypothetical protein